MTSDQSQIINYLVRMVIPMRREFQRDIDVAQIQCDPAYARDVLAQASTSQDPRLRDHAAYVSARLSFGPRSTSGTQSSDFAPTHAAELVEIDATLPVAGTAPMTFDDMLQPTAANPTAVKPVAAAAAEPVAAPPAESAPLEADALRQRIMQKYTSGLR